MEENYDMSEYEAQLDTPIESESENVETQEAVDNSEESSTEEQSLEDRLASLDEQTEDSENVEQAGLLDQINQLGVLRKGLPVEFNDENELKEILSKGYDYTQKTMELAQERENLQAELTEAQEYLQNERDQFEEYKANHEQEIVENQFMVKVLEDLKLQDPEVFDEITRRYQELERAYSMHEHNPAFKQLNEKYQNLESKLTEKLDAETQAEYQTIRDQWESGLNEAQSKYGQRLKTLGIKVDWNQVQDHWKKDATGTITPEQSLMAVYGDQMTKALDQRAKLAQTKSKVGQLTNTGKASKDQKEVKFRDGRGAYDDMNYLDSIYNKVIG